MSSLLGLALCPLLSVWLLGELSISPQGQLQALFGAWSKGFGFHDELHEGSRLECGPCE